MCVSVWCVSVCMCVWYMSMCDVCLCVHSYMCVCAPTTPWHRSGSSVSGPISPTQTHPQFIHRQQSLMISFLIGSLVLKQPPMLELDKCQFWRNHSISVRSLLHDRICPFQTKYYTMQFTLFYDFKSCFFTILNFKHKTCKWVFRIDPGSLLLLCLRSLWPGLRWFYCLKAGTVRVFTI